MTKARWKRSYDSAMAETVWRKTIPRKECADLHLEVMLPDGDVVCYARAWSTEPGDDTVFTYPGYEIKSSRAFKPVSFVSPEAAKGWCERLIQDPSGVIPEALWTGTNAHV